MVKIHILLNNKESCNPGRKQSEVRGKLITVELGGVIDFLNRFRFPVLRRDVKNGAEKIMQGCFYVNNLNYLMTVTRFLIKSL